MSAYFVDTDTVSVMIAAALGRTEPNHVGNAAANPLRWWDGESHYLRTEDATDVGRMLLQENLNSLAHRYELPDDETAGYEGTIAEYEYPAGGWIYTLSAGDVVSAMDCYTYQSCEHPAWSDSSAAAFCRELERRILRHLVPDGSWGFDAGDLRERRSGARSLLDMLG